MQKKTPDNIRGIVRRLGERFRANGVPVKQLLLFGSFATGKEHAWSDIDVAVIHEPFLETRGKEKALLFEEGKSLDVRLEVLSFRPEDLKNRYSSIAQEVQRYGVPIE